MTGQSPRDAQDEPAAYEAFRDGFGSDLVRAARASEQWPKVRRRRTLVIAIPLAAVALAAFAFVRLPAPGPASGPVFGAEEAVAAVRELQNSLLSGVLVREAVTVQQIARRTERSTVTDWTDLRTRDRRTRVQSDASDTEYWDVSLHERWEQNRAWAARDGRAVVNHTIDLSTENGSASESPAEEVARLVALARKGELTLRRDGDAQVIERSEGCYANAELTYIECPDPQRPSPWPGKVPKGLTAVTNFETWWLSVGPRPKVLRYENGVTPVSSGKRRVTYRTRYLRWEVLPPTPANRALVAPPAFPANEYLVLEGPYTVGRELRKGTVRCTLPEQSRC